MSTSFDAVMRQALNLTRASDPAAATMAIRRALAGGRHDTSFRSSEPETTAETPKELHRESGSRPAIVIDHDPDEHGKPAREAKGAGAERKASTPSTLRFQRNPLRMRKPLGEVIRLLAANARLAGSSVPAPTATPTIPSGASFESRTFECAAGSRVYKIYIPASCAVRPRGLLVMLHGCKQNPDDFATGTGMNALAEDHRLAVVYPAQAGSANAASCWNWFNPHDQRRDAGEPSIIAGITRDVAADFGIPRAMTFAAGLSAGGAMAAVLGSTYPDVYAAIGVHSGLPYAAANDVLSAFAAMRGNHAASPRGEGSQAANGEFVRTIVFHGNADTTVHPSNGRAVASAAERQGEFVDAEETSGSRGGRRIRMTVSKGVDETAGVETWMVEGAGHAWFGGNPAGSFTDPLGPNASEEMIRFFLQGQ